MDELTRCAWSPAEGIYAKYHDEEWGVPATDDGRLFEMLILESFQAGLSWLTILKKREAFRAAFEGFDPVRVAAYGEADIARLMADKGIVRCERKLRAAIGNARGFLEIQKEFGSFARYLWGFADYAPILGDGRLTTTPLAERLSKDLKRRGMSFVGPVIVYAYLQAVGVVNGHDEGCFLRHRSELAANTSIAHLAHSGFTPMSASEG